MRRTLKRVCTGAAIGLMMLGVTAHGVSAFRMPLEPIDERPVGADLSAYSDKQKFLAFNDDPKIRKFHLGEDWNGNKGASKDIGLPIYPIGHGVVRYAQETGVPSWGYVVIVKHDYNGLCSFYGHVEDPDRASTEKKIKVTVGQEVSPDNPIASIGDANGYYMDAAHLHFEILRCDLFPDIESAGKSLPGYVGSSSPSLNWWTAVYAIDQTYDPSPFIQENLYSYAVPLDRGWNQVKNVFREGFRLQRAKVIYDGKSSSLAQAATDKVVQNDVIEYPTRFFGPNLIRLKASKEEIIESFSIYAERAGMLLLLYGSSWKWATLDQMFADGDYVRTTTPSLNVRSDAGTNAPVISTISAAGTEGHITCITKTCWKISSDGYLWRSIHFDSPKLDGWVVQAYLKHSTKAHFPVTAPPSPPVQIQAMPISPSQILIGWQPTIELAVVHFNDIYRNGFLVARVRNDTSFIDRSLNANTAYRYQIIAGNNAGRSKASAPASATTLIGTDRTPPTIPRNLTAVALSARTIQLNWSAVVGAAHYAVFRNGVRYVRTDAPSEFDNGLNPETSYTYQVAALDAAGNMSWLSASVSATTLPAPPTSTKFKKLDPVATITQADVRNVADDPATLIGNQPIQSYGIVYSGPKVGDGEIWWWVLFDDLPSGQHTPSGWVRERFLRSAPEYYGDHTPPETPLFVRADGVGSIGVDLEWGAVVDNPGGSGVASYRLLRNGKNIFEGLQVLYFDAGPPLGVPLRYSVVAVDTEGNISPESNVITVTLPIPPSSWSFSVGMRIASTTWVSPRILPEGSSKQLPPVPTGTKGTVLEIGPVTSDGAWVRVVFDEGTSGWVVVGWVLPL